MHSGVISSLIGVVGTARRRLTLGVFRASNIVGHRSQRLFQSLVYCG